MVSALRGIHHNLFSANAASPGSMAPLNNLPANSGLLVDSLQLSPEAEKLYSSEEEGTKSTGAPGASAPFNAPLPLFRSASMRYGNMMNITSQYLAMILGGSLGLNGTNAGQNEWSGGGNVEGTAGYDDLIDTFYQGNRGNCASIATIKAAMDVYGEDVFQSVEQNPDGGCNITMKDGVELSLSAQEMKIAEGMADIEGMEGEEKDYAIMCYAAMAKRAQMEHNDHSLTYMGACRSLNNGEWPEDAARFLGLEDYMMPVDINQVENTSYDSLVLWSDEHALYADYQEDDYVADFYGEEYAYDGTDGYGNDLEGAYTFI